MKILIELLGGLVMVKMYGMRIHGIQTSPMVLGGEEVDFFRYDHKYSVFFIKGMNKHPAPLIHD